ncbi:hypothetical protein Lfu02_75160 [Longispora fulva]|uniref:Uncharacterized protein n=1 Tax=Longispora fulva TaxID=619741 RepID=A0A8J7KUP0_9ACTN|nr:hypothetical protein [Longispora fulva]MBG6134252.1 hypothetical protein [Longispora fulva]GIG63144.1 hypothetical protein Lfu02_75160 [Longispora fulva]
MSLAEGSPIPLPTIPPVTGPAVPRPAVPPKSSIRIYRLGDPAAVVGQTDEIRAALFPGTQDRQLQVHPASGALWFDTGRRSGGTRPLPGPQARELALGFLEGARRRIAGSARLRGAGLDQLLPGDLRLVDTLSFGASAPGNGARTVCRFARLLRPGSTEAPVPVLGESVDVWVDAGGTVQALASTCRVLTGDEPVARIVPPKDDDPAAEVPEEEKMKLIYVSGDEDAERDTTCPFWIRYDDDEAELAPASGHSMLVRILPTTGQGAMGFTADVYGGSGRYAYAWRAWSPSAPGEFLDLGSGGTARIGPGVYDVALRVRDTVHSVTERAALRVMCS